MSFRLVAVVCLVGGIALGQTPPKKAAPKEPAKPTPGSLEDTLDKALRNSADIKAAEAKVRESEALLNVVRQQVLSKATSLHNDLNQAKRMLPVLEAALKEQTRLIDAKLVSKESMLAAQVAIEKQRGEIEKLETELKALRGEFAVKSPTISPDGRVLYTTTMEGVLRAWDRDTGKAISDVNTYRGLLSLAGRNRDLATAVQPSMAERVRKLLNQEIEFRLDSSPEAAVEEVLRDGAKSDVPIRSLLQRDAPSLKVVLAGKMPVGAFIQAIEDTDPNLRVVIRDYGLLLTSKDRVPDGAIRAVDFWKTKDEKTK